MFRKAFQSTKSRSAVKSSDRRKLRAEVLSLFSSINDEQLSTLLPSKETKDEFELASMKFITSGGDQGVVYFIDSQPSFFRLDSHPLLPTVYTLLKFPTMIHTIMTHGPVLQRLIQGADLMLPGVIIPGHGLHEFKANDPISVTIPQSSMPLVVGVTCVSRGQAMAQNMRGKGVKVLHTCGDQLWALGDKSLPPQDQTLHNQDAEEPAVNEDAWHDGSAEKVPDTMVVGVGQEKEEAPEHWGEPLEDVNVKQEEAQEIIEAGADGTAGYDDGSSSSSSKVSPADMDILLEISLLTAIKLKAPEDPKAFPIGASQFYSAYIIPSRPVGTSVDVKGSSYKKLQKFLKVYEKKGYLKLKEVRSELVIMSVATHHQDITGFVPPSKQAVDLYGARGSTLPLFEAMGLGKDALLTMKELRSCVDDYIKRRDLIDATHPRTVNLDALLADVVLKKDDTAVLISRDELLQRIANMMQPFHQIAFPNREPQVRKGTLPPIHILVEKVRGTKTATRVSNMEYYDVDTEQLADHLKVKCASSTSVSPLPVGKQVKPRHEIMVQGSKALEVCNVLKDIYGIPFGKDGASKYVEVENKAGKRR
ncbi:hypothetical protein SeLEV6574_g01568 [Synchytrium endobioticum]|uniref:Uncharacterized protein n=1 Tax=Synchytrium endobioticum TaxID=286115 RepID=A0A507DCC6_9FUNG|nr:hypothetical protein SeLEV6574_g01568 [Synchytrium endobioticum]